MKPNCCWSANRVAEIALLVTLAGLTAVAFISCEYFDPLDPLSRVPREPESTITWTQVIFPSFSDGGTGDNAGMCVQQTEDGGFIIAGYMESKVGTNSDVWLVKTDTFGNGEWDATYGGSGNDRAFSVEQTPDGGYIVVGYKQFDRGGGAWDADLWLFKVKPDDQGSGELDWEQVYGDSGTDEEGACVRRTDDGGYIITGTKMDTVVDYDCLWLIKTDDGGNLDPSWDPNPKTFWGDATTIGECVSQTVSDLGFVTGYVVAGTSWLDSSHDAYLIKTDEAGIIDPTWATNPFAFGASDDPDFASYIQQTSDSGYIVSGATRSFDAAGMDALVIKLDASGNLDTQWATNPRSLHRALDTGGDETANCVQQTSDGGYILAGMAHGQDQDAWLVKTDASGNMLWDKCFGGAGYDEAKSVRETDDGGYILAGLTNSYPGGLNLYLVYYKP